MTDPLPDALADAAYSDKLLYLLLRDHGPLTQLELKTITHAPERTIRESLERLDDAGVLSTAPNIHDARQTYYDVQG